MSTSSKPDRKKLVKKLDEVYSQYVRLKDAVDGEAICVTCGVKKPWRELQNGHFYTRGRFPTRWNDDNCHVQCVACNVFLKGNYIVYTKYMIDRYGREFVDDLERLSHSGIKMSTPDMKDEIERLVRIVKNLN